MSDKFYKLDAYEQSIEDALNDNNFVSVENEEQEIAIAKQAAINYCNVHPKEQWLFNNKKALASLKAGMEDVRAGRVVDKGSFAKFIDNNIT